MCYEWVIFHIGCEALFNLHGCTTIISQLKAALKARVRGFPIENFQNLFLNICNSKEFFHIMNRTKINILKKQISFFFSLKI